MKKKILMISFTLLAINCLGQKWTDYEIDDNLTVHIPENYEVMDTLGQLIIRAQIDNALIMIQRIPNEGEGATNIQNKDELIDNYEGFQNGFIESQNGKLMNQQSVERDGLQLTKFKYYATMGEEKQIRYCLAIFVNEYWYAIQFWGVEAMSDQLTKDREMLFSSIRFPPGQSLKNQLSNSIEGSRSYNIGFLIGKALGYILMFGIIVSLIIWISKKRGRKTKNAQQDV